MNTNNSKQCSSNSKNGNNKKRLSQYQVEVLEASFYGNNKLEAERKLQLAHELGVPPRQIAIWYQNKRARWKNQSMEVEYTTVSTRLETTLAQIRQLEQELHGLRVELRNSQAEMSTMINANYNYYVHANHDQVVEYTSNYVQQPHGTDEYLQPPPPPPPPPPPADCDDYLHDDGDDDHHHMMNYSALMSDDDDQEDLTVDHEFFSFFMGTD